MAFGDRFYLQGQQSVAHRAGPVNGISGAGELGISEATFHRSKKPIRRDEHQRSVSRASKEGERPPQEAGHRHSEGGEQGKLLSPTRRKALSSSLVRRRTARDQKPIHNRSIYGRLSYPNWRARVSGTNDTLSDLSLRVSDPAAHTVDHRGAE